jgi:hypothetical protein
MLKNKRTRTSEDESMKEDDTHSEEEEEKGNNNNNNNNNDNEINNNTSTVHKFVKGLKALSYGSVIRLTIDGKNPGYFDTEDDADQEIEAFRISDTKGYEMSKVLKRKRNKNIIY